MDLEFNSMEFVYKGNTEQFKDGFVIKIDTLNDLIFGHFTIRLLNTTGIIGLTNRIAGAAVHLRLFMDMKEDTRVYERAYDLLSIDDLDSADYYGKDPSLCGKIKVKLYATVLHKSLEEDEKDSMVKRLVRGLMSSEFTASFGSINNLTSFLMKGSSVCNIKSLAGVMIVDNILLKKLHCEESIKSGKRNCLLKTCMCGYTTLSSDASRIALRHIDYCLGAYLDSKLWKMVIKPGSKFEKIKDSKLRYALERLDIPENKFIEYFEGDSKNAGSIMFIDQNMLVISFRGTLSHTDMISDLNAAYVPFLDGYAHSGILNMSKNFISTELDRIVEILKFNDLKKILMVGHSLGGAVATQVYLMVQKECLLPGYEIYAVTFASPPSVSKSFLSEDFPNLTTYNYGEDIVPRLSLGALLDFKYLCLSIANIHNVFSKSVDSVQKIEEIQRYLRDSDLYPKLYQPGRVYHIKEGEIDGKKKYGFKQVDPVFFSDLICFKGFLDDHFLKKHIEAFKQCLQE